MRFLSSLLLASLPLLTVSASSAGTTSNLITLPLSRRHMSIQAVEDEINQKEQHVMNKDGKSKTFTSMAAQPLLNGCPQMDFTTGVTVAGTTYNLIVDTGSSSLAIASTGCANCPQPQYTPTNIVQGAAQATAKFGDGSGWTGPVVLDNVALTGTNAVPVNFVAIQTQNMFFRPGACNNFNANTFANEGIIGFAYQSLAVSTTNTFFGQLQASTGIPNMFSMMECYTTGTMTLGGVTPGQSTGLFYYTPIIQKAWYVVQVMNMQLGGQSIGLSAATFANDPANGSPANAIVDSGTSLMILPPTAYNAYITALNNNQAFKAAFGQNAASLLAQRQCIPLLNGMTGQNAINFVNQNLPTMDIVMGGGFTLNLGAATSYLLPRDATTQLFCPGIANGGSTITILGWGIHSQYVIVYDVANSQVGFATQVGCGNQVGGAITPGTATGQQAPGGQQTPPQTQATTAPATTAPVVTTPTTAPTPMPPAATMNCPKGKFGPNCATVYDIIQATVGLPFKVVQTPGRNGNTFAMAFAQGMATAAGTVASNVMILQTLPKGNGKQATIVQFALLAADKAALLTEEQNLVKNFLKAQAKLVNQALLGQLSADQTDGLTILDNSGSGAMAITQDGVIMDDGNNGVPIGAIIGAAVGGVVLIVLVAGVIIYRRRAAKSTTSVESTKGTPTTPNTPTTINVQPSSTKSAVAWYV